MNIKFMNSSLPTSILDTVPRGKNILLPESNDIRVLVAAIALKTAGIIEPLLIGDYAAMLSILSDEKKRVQYNLGSLTLSDIDILKSISLIESDSNPRDQLVTDYATKKLIEESSVQNLFPADLAQAAHLLKTQQVDGVVTGSIADTKDVIRV